MLDVKRVLKAAPTKMRSQEPLQQLWTPWGEQIAGEWLSSNDAHKAFCPAKDGERKLENGRTPILNEHPRPTMVRGNHTMLNGFWDYAIVSIPESGNGSKWRNVRRQDFGAVLPGIRAFRRASDDLPRQYDLVSHGGASRDAWGRGSGSADRRCEPLDAAFRSGRLRVRLLYQRAVCRDACRGIFAV